MRKPKDKKSKEFLIDLDKFDWENLKDQCFQSQERYPTRITNLWQLVKPKAERRIYEYLSVLEMEIQIRLERILTKEQRLLEAKGNKKKVT